MAESPNRPETPQTPLASPGGAGITGAELGVLAGLAVWTVIVFVLSIYSTPPAGQDGFDGLRYVGAFLAVLLPAGIAWCAFGMSRAMQDLQQDNRRLQAMVDQLRQVMIADRQGRQVTQTAAERRAIEAAEVPRTRDHDTARFSTRREPERRPTARPPVAALTEEQPSLALGTPAEEPGAELTRQDMIRALNFPDSEKDEEGFAALRRALRGHQARQLVQASQDILTLLSQDGIYMDDLNPDRAKPEVWRRFAHGERGRTVASLGGVRDRTCLAVAIGRMREDTIFRDAAHHFLRLFDRMLVAFEAEATDEELSDLSETRTARAFMLLGRVTGAFD
jgi:hypothetical protein